MRRFSAKVQLLRENNLKRKEILRSSTVMQQISNVFFEIMDLDLVEN